MTDNIARIARISARLRMICGLLIVAIPIVMAIWWFFAEGAPNVLSRLPQVPVLSPLTFKVRLMCFLVSLIPAGVAIYALTRLRHLFGLYQQGKIFMPENVRCYRQLGRTLFAWAAASFIYTPLITMAVTSNNPPGKGMISLSLSSDDVLAVMVGLVVLTIAWVMDEGRKIREDQELIV